ncbi:hypothetical protein [Paenibacillus lutrae]|uniref:Lipoprotein n=1 Tax=Paenibacillus lutrae TaxID=2078573 RepID=A0A7X3JYY4_9BACL|nr:hypothetical protein [Paenibacillus lutrae]MVO99390.1 hypothetical protein [Paenibacillus lutrae]
MFKKWLLLAFVAVVPAALVNGCTDRAATRAAVQQALTKQAEMNSYSFTGNAELKMNGLPAAEDISPLTAQLFSFLKDSRISWKGSVEARPFRTQTDLILNSRSAGAELTIPVFFQDNKLYFRLPLLNQKDEYFVTSLKSPGDPQDTNAVDKLQQVSSLTSDLSDLLMEGADAAWFDEEDTVLADGSSAKSYTAAVTRVNAGAWNKQLQEKLPRVLDALAANGFISDTQAALWKKEAAEFKLKAPGKWSVTVDGQGFLRKQEIDLVFTAGDSKPDTSEDKKITLQQTFDGINQMPAVQKEVPARTKSFDEILKRLEGASK